MLKLTPKELAEVNRLRAIFPSEIRVHIRRSQDGGFVAEIITYSGCFTQADNFTSLMEMVNDAIYSYFEIPKRYLAHMPKYIPPTELAQWCGIYPAIGVANTIELIRDNETIKC
jgi:predicted RNase H-like HicB family nuclease